MSKGVLVTGREAFLRDVGEALTGGGVPFWQARGDDEALRLLEQHAAELCAHLLEMSVEGAPQLLTRSLQAQPDLATIAFAADDPQARMALELGASECLTGSLQADLLLLRLRNLEALRTFPAQDSGRDALTGIDDRAGFYAHASRLLAARAPNEEWELQMWDVDHFKVVNDLCGREAGDRILREFASAFAEKLGDAGAYGRLESDHFALCLPSALFAKDELLRHVEGRIEKLNVGFRITPYVGVYPHATAEADVALMCDRAAMALKAIKGNYHIRWAVYDDAMREAMLLEQELVADMNRALQEDQFCLYLQPLYSLTTGEPISAEALVRWNHPRLGLLAPGLFIPLFERNGFITKLDAYMWERACSYLQGAKRKGLQVLPISVNVSRLNLYNPHLSEEIIELARRYDVEPNLLKLEITESAYTDNPQQLLDAMQQLQSHGFEILMDDFGSGYSSLNMLKDVPVDILKVDMRFLDDMDKNSRAGNVLTSVIRMAKWLRIIVVAEGVETQAQIDFLRSIGCDRVQGFFFSKPLPIEEYEKLLLNPHAALATREEEREKLLSSYDFDAVWEGSEQMAMLFGAMIGSVGLYERAGDELEVLRVNEGYYQLMGCTPQTLFSDGRNILAHLEPEDRPHALEALTYAAETGEVQQVQARRRHEDGRMLWLDVKIRHLGNVGLRSLYYIVTSDVTQQKELERKSLLYQYGAAMLDAYSEVLELDFTDQLVSSISLNSSNDFRTRMLPLEYALHFYAENRVHPDDRELFEQTYTEKQLSVYFTEQKRRSFSLELRTRKLGKPYHWTRLTLYPMADEDGKNRALSCARDIDDQRQTDRMREENRILQAKEREQQRYRTVVEQTGTAVMEWDLTAQSAEFTPLFEEYQLSHCDFSDLYRGHIPPNCVHPQDVPLMQNFLSRARDGMTNIETKLRLTRVDGHKPWCLLRAALIKDAHGTPQRIVLTINDIDQQRKTQMLLSAQQEENDRRLTLLTSLYWTLPCGIWQMNAGERPYTLFNNRACWQLFGFSQKQAFEAATSNDPAVLVVPEERAAFRERMRLCRSQKGPQEFDMNILRADGQQGSLHGTLSLETQSDGNPMLQFVFMDTSQLAEKERNLQETQATLRRASEALQHLLDNLPVGVSLFTLEQKVKALYLNEQTRSIFGMPDGDLSRFSELMQRQSVAVNQEKIETTLAATEDGRKMAEMLTRARRADGSAFWLRSYSTMLLQENAAPLCYAVLIDVTKQVELERAYNRQSELYRLMMEESQILFFDYDIELDSMTYSSPGGDGKREERVVPDFARTLRHSRIVHEDCTRSMARVLRKYSRTSEPGIYEFMADFNDTGAYRWYRAYFRSIADENGALFRMIGRVDDVSEEKRTEEQLSQVKIFRRAINSVSLFVFEFDLPGIGPRLLSSAREDGSFYPYLDYLMPERNRELIHPDELESFNQALESAHLLQLYRSGTREVNLQFRARTHKNEWIWLGMTLHLSHSEDRTSARGIGYVKVIEDQKALERRAELDSVTGLLNRATVEERISAYLKNGDGDCCLLIFDVDDFKGINDTHGHAEGDRLLRDISDTLHAHFRKTDMLGRLGGDEFVALLCGPCSRQSVSEKAEELLNAVHELSLRYQWQNPITLSVGVALYPDDGRTFAELYRAADQALYRAKGGGKNRYCLYEPE